MWVFVCFTTVACFYRNNLRYTGLVNGFSGKLFYKYMTVYMHIQYYILDCVRVQYWHQSDRVHGGGFTEDLRNKNVSFL